MHLTGIYLSNELNNIDSALRALGGIPLELKARCSLTTQRAQMRARENETNNTMTTTCKGCGEPVAESRAALSRYGHGNICSDCGVREAFAGNFIPSEIANSLPDDVSMDELDFSEPIDMSTL